MGALNHLEEPQGILSIHLKADSSVRPLGKPASSPDAPASQFLGRPLHPCNAAILTEEDSDIMLGRIHQFRVDLDRWDLALRCLYEPDHVLPTFQETLLAAFEDLRRIGGKLLVIDTLNAWAGSLKLEYHEEAAREFLQKLRALAQLRGVAVLLLHHTTKYTGRARGVEALSDGMDTLIRLELPFENATQRILHVRPRVGEPYTLAFEWSPFDGFMVEEVLNAPDAIWQILPRDRSLRVTEIMELTGLSKAGVHKAMQKLAAEGRVKVSGDGKRFHPFVFRRV
jgi:hypothetical protein